MTRIPPGTETPRQARLRRRLAREAAGIPAPPRAEPGPYRADEALILAREKILEARRLLKGPFADRMHGGVPINEELFDLIRGLIDPTLVLLSRLWTIRTGRIWRSTQVHAGNASDAEEVRGFRRG